MGSLFAGNPMVDGDQVIYISEVGGDFYASSFTRGTSNKSDNSIFNFDTRKVSEQQSITIKINDVYDEFATIGYSWSTDGGTTYNGATKIESLVPIQSPFIGVLGVTTYDDPGLIPLDYGDCLALAQKQTDAAGKQIVCKRFSYNSWAWGTEVVISSDTTVQSCPSGYLMDDIHIVVGFIDDTDTANRKARFCVSQDLLGLTWDEFNNFETTDQIYNLSLCKIGDNIVAGYDDGTDSKCRISMNNGYYFTKQANQITIETGGTDPFILPTSNRLFLCLLVKGATTEVYPKISQFGQSWEDLTTPNPVALGDGATENITYPCGFLDDDDTISILGRTSLGGGYFKWSDDIGLNWYDHDTESNILPDSAGLAVCDTGGFTMILLKGIGSAKSISALMGRVWTKDIFLSKAFPENYLAINGKPDDLGWTLDGSDEGSISNDLWKIDTVAAGTVAQTYYKKSWNPNIDIGFIDCFRMKIGAGGGNNESCIRKYVINNGISFELAFSTTEVVLKDLQTSTDIKTDVHDYTALHDFVVAAKKVGTDVHYNIYRKESSSAWNGTWNKIACGVTDGYIGEGGGGTTETGFGDNDTVSGENSTSYWQNIFLQDASDMGMSASAPVLTSRKSSGASTTLHRIDKNIGIGISGSGSAKNNEYTVSMASNVAGSNLFSTVIDAPLMSASDNIDWYVYLSAQRYKTNSYYHFDFLGVKGMNVRKLKVWGTNTGNATAVEKFGKLWAVNTFPDETTWSPIATLDSSIGVTGTITAIGASWLTVSGKTWTNNQYKGFLCEIDNGVNKKLYKIDENTSDTLIFYGTSLISDGYTTTDTITICSGEAGQKVTLQSQLFLKIEIEPTLTQDDYYKISFFSPARKYAPATDFYNPLHIDDGTQVEWKPNIEMYQGKSGLRRTFKQGPTRKERQIFFIDNNDSSEILEFEKWLEHINFEETPVLYVEDDTALVGSNMIKLVLGRFTGGLKVQHVIESKEKIDMLTLSEEV